MSYLYSYIVCTLPHISSLSLVVVLHFCDILKLPKAKNLVSLHSCIDFTYRVSQKNRIWRTMLDFWTTLSNPGYL